MNGDFHMGGHDDMLSLGRQVVSTCPFQPPETVVCAGTGETMIPSGTVRPELCSDSSVSDADSMERDYAGAAAPGGGYEGFLGRRGRRLVTDYGPLMVHWMRHRRPYWQGPRGIEAERPSLSYMVDMLPPAATPDNPANTIPVKHLHSSLNKVKHPINVVRWTPEGRRLLTASSSGEFTLWNGTAFNFETIMQAHDSAIRAAIYSHSDDWLLSADQEGTIKYWQPNFNNVKVLQAHTDPIRDLAFSPTDSKFATASDDSTIKIFDFAGGAEEATLTGHNWDVKSVDWHPSKGLLVSGSKDHLIKLWDPRTGRCLTTLRGHKNAISRTVFEPTRGQLLATCARDQTARIFDLRIMRDICLLRGHDRDISTLTWHPVHVSLLSTGGIDGSLFHYQLDEPNPPPGVTPSLAPYDTADPSTAPPMTVYPAHRVPHAHEFAVWSLDWHPVGHILASGSNDRVTRFWTRPRPGETDCFYDRYHLGEAAAEAQGTYDRRGMRRQQREQEEQEIEDEADGLVDQKMPARPPAIPGLPGLPGMSAPAPLGGAPFDGASDREFYADGAAAAGPNSIPLPPPPLPLPPPPPSQLHQEHFPRQTLPQFDPANPPDLSKFAAMMGGSLQHPLPPPPPGAAIAPGIGGPGTAPGGPQGQRPPIPPFPLHAPPLPGMLPHGVGPPGTQFPPPLPPPPPQQQGAAHGALGAQGGVGPPHQHAQAPYQQSLPGLFAPGATTPAPGSMPGSAPGRSAAPGTDPNATGIMDPSSAAGLAHNHGYNPNFAGPPGPGPGPPSGISGSTMVGGDSGSETGMNAGVNTTAANGAAAGAGSIRKRAPLPSQQESLAMEQMQGKYRSVR